MFLRSSKPLIRASLILAAFSALFIASSVAYGHSVAAASSDACETPVSGKAVHEFVTKTLGFDQKLSGKNTSNGRTYLTSKASKYGSEKKPQTLPWEKWQEAIKGNPHPRWIWVPYTFDDEVYPGKNSSKGKISLVGFLTDLVNVKSESERKKMIKQIYKLNGKDVHKSRTRASTATVRKCKTLSGQQLWDEVFVRIYQYGAQERRAYAYHSRRKGMRLPRISSTDQEQMVRTYRLDERQVRAFLDYMELRDSDVDKLVARLKEKYSL